MLTLELEWTHDLRRIDGRSLPPADRGFRELPGLPERGGESLTVSLESIEGDSALLITSPGGRIAISDEGHERGAEAIEAIKALLVG